MTISRKWIAFFFSIQLIKVGSIFRHIDFSLPFPPLNEDQVIYYARALRAQIFLSHSNRLWGYDPFQMGGYVAGPIHEAGSNLINLILYALAPFSPIWLSMLWIMFFGLLLMPLIVVPTVKNFGGSGTQAWLSFGVVCLMHGMFEPLSRWLMVVGLFTYQVACFLCLYQASLFWRWVQDKKWTQFAGFCVLSVFLPQLHPTSVLMFVVPNTVAYLLFFKKLKPLDHAFVFAAAAATFLANYYWLVPTVVFSYWKISNRYLVPEGWNEFIRVLNPFQPNLINSFSWILHSFVGVGLVYSLREIGRKNWKLAALILAWLLQLAALGAFGNHIPVIEGLQPRRFLLLFWIIVYVVSTRAAVFRWGNVQFKRFVFLNVVFGLVLGLSFFERSNRYLRNYLTPSQIKFEAFMLRNRALNGQMLLECGDVGDPHFNDLLPLSTGKPVLGGPNAGCFLISRTTIFAGQYIPDEAVVNWSMVGKPIAFNHYLSEMSEAEFSSYLDLYNIGLVTVRSPESKKRMASYRKNFKLIRREGVFWIYEYKKKNSWFIKGSGRVKLDYDKITLTDLSKGPVLLKLHWIETLKTEPPLPIKPVYLKDDPVPFISFHNPEKQKVVIYNAGL